VTKARPVSDHDARQGACRINTPDDPTNPLSQAANRTISSSAEVSTFESISSTFAKTGRARLGDVIRNACSLIYTRESEDYLGWGEFRAEGLRDGAARWRRM
jgi:hypothetical protein